MGHTSDCIVTSDRTRRFSGDYKNLEMDKKGYSGKIVSKFKTLMTVTSRYDVLHFHGTSIFPFMAEVPLLRVLQKKIIIHIVEFM